MCSADITIRWTWVFGPEVGDGPDAGHAVAYARRAGREIGFEGALGGLLCPPSTSSPS